MQARVLTPSMFIAQEPHTPSRQDRRKVNVVSISFLILIKASKIIGPQSLRSIAKVSMTGFFPSSGFHRYTLNSRTRVAPAGPGTVLPTPIFEFAGRVNSAIDNPSEPLKHDTVTPAKEAVRKLINAPKDHLQRGRACFETRPLGAPQHEVIL